MNKTYRMLALYHRLMQDGRITQQDYIQENNISERTFDRDIADLRAFLQDSFTGLSVSYDFQSKTYMLEKTDMDIQKLEEHSAYFLCSLLLQNHALPASEREYLMLNLLTPFSVWEKDRICNLLEKTEQRFDEELVSKRMPLRTIGDLLLCIEQEKAITLHFNDGRKEEDCAPYTLLFGLQDGVLIAWSMEEKQPATYCLSEIHSFDIGESFYFMRSEIDLMKRIVQEQNQIIFNQKG